MAAYVGETCKGTQSASATTLALTVSTAPGAGNLLIARVGAFDATNALSSVTDSKGNTWSTYIPATGISRRPAIAWTLQDVGTLTGSDTITFHWAAAISFAAVIVDEFSGMASVPLDQSSFQNNGTANTSRATLATGSTVQASELVLGAWETGNTESSFTNGGGFSSFTTPSLSQGTNVTIEGEYQFVAATGTQQPSATGGTSATSTGIAITFKTAAAAAVALRALLGVGT